MFKALKMKIAARRMERKSVKKRANTKKSRKSVSRRQSFWGRVWHIICAPFRYIGRALVAFWRWIRDVNMIGLINITLLCTIIVLFSMLIMDIVGCGKKSVIIFAKNENTPTNTITQNEQPRNVRARDTKNQSVTLPLQKTCDNELIGAPVNVTTPRVDTVAIKQTARRANIMYGDVIIDSRGAATMLKSGDVIKGNLYLQNMRKYVLPRGIRIEGNLFLRDMGMLQFSGGFTVTGNIYVTPSSSFGPIPGTARIGGYVIL